MKPERTAAENGSRTDRVVLRENGAMPGITLIRAKAMRDDFRRHTHRSILIGTVQHGSRRLLLPSGELTIAAGNGFLLPAELPHRCLLPEPHSYRVASVAPALWRELTHDNAPETALLLDAGSPPLLAARRLIGCLRSNPEPLAIEQRLLDFQEALRMAGYFGSQWATNAATAASSSLPSERIERSRAWLEAHCTEPVHLQALAEVAGCSAGTITRQFTRFVGLPPYEYALQIRLRLAAQRLRETQDALTTIALDLGFADQSHLQRFFRRAYGATPNTYRRHSTQQPAPNSRARDR